MIYVDAVPFEIGSREWVKLANFMNQRMKLIFDAELENKGAKNIMEMDINDMDYYLSFSKFFAPKAYSDVKANQTVKATYLLLIEDGYFVPDIEMYYVLHRVMRNYMRRLKADTGNAVLKICDEEREMYEELLKPIIEHKYYVEDRVTLDEEIEYFEDIRNYEDIIFIDSDYKIFDETPESILMNRKRHGCSGVDVFTNENYMFQNQLSGQWIYMDAVLGRKRFR